MFSFEEIYKNWSQVLKMLKRHYFENQKSKTKTTQLEKSRNESRGFIGFMIFLPKMLFFRCEIKDNAILSCDTLWS